MDASVPSLQEIVWSRWPEVAARLGERRGAFVEVAVSGAQRFGLDDDASSARFLNVCFAFGPGFESQPEHEWALATLSDPRLTAAARIHQLVRQAVGVLERTQGDARRLRDGDEALLDQLEALRGQAGDERPLVPRRACDLETLQVSVASTAERREYACSSGLWQRQAAPAPASACRVDAARPMPELIHLLADAAPDRVTQLVVRQQQHAVCGEHHPALRWIDERGIARWHGHAALAVSWPVRPPPLPLAQAVHLAEETSPAVGVLEVESCGLRDTGVPLGPQRTRVAVYPAAQHLFRLQRPGGARWRLPASEGAAALADAPACRTRLEREGTALTDPRWGEGFDTKLPQAVGAGLERLLEAWQQAAASATLRASEDLLCGRAELAWGWREAPDGLACPPFLRVQADLELELAFAVELKGEVPQGSASAHLRLRAGGKEPLRFAAAREDPAADLLQALLPARARARWPFSASFDPITTPDAVLWTEAGPCAGAVVAEAGLRPRLSGGSGWEFFLRLDLEPVLLPVALHDPVLGHALRTLALLPAMNLADWSLG